MVCNVIGYVRKFDFGVHFAVGLNLASLLRSVNSVYRYHETNDDEDNTRESLIQLGIRILGDIGKKVKETSAK